MDRIYLKDLIEWNNRKRRKPLIVYGARQVGKSYLIRNLFAEKYYKGKYIYIDFKRNVDERKFFDNHMDPMEIIQYLSVKYNMKINKETLLIFDEIQECLSALTSLKYFHQDYSDIPIIASGSMVRIKTGRNTKEKDFFFPVGSMTTLFVYPMTFKEYMMNTNQNLWNVIQEAYAQKKPLSRDFHDLAMVELYKFLLIGGLPEAVNEYIESGSLLDARRVLKDIYGDYLSDMNLYQASEISITRTKRMFENAYRQLNKENENFRFSEVEKGAKRREYDNALYWLSCANLVYPCYCLKERITQPLSIHNESVFKVYLHDNGLLAMQSEISMVNFIDSNKWNTISGLFFENYVATELSSKNIKLFYWKGKNDNEFEFIVNYNGEIVPIDVKKKKGSLHSLKAYKNHNACNLAIRISSQNYMESDDIVTIPLYMVPLLVEDITLYL